MPSAAGYRSFLSGGDFDLRYLIDSFDQQNLLVVVDLLKLDFDDLAAAGGHVLADVGGLDRQLTMTAVDEYG
jgi:hypothetical protein